MRIGNHRYWGDVKCPYTRLEYRSLKVYGKIGAGYPALKNWIFFVKKWWILWELQVEYISQKYILHLCWNQEGLRWLFQISLPAQAKNISQLWIIKWRASWRASYNRIKWLCQWFCGYYARVPLPAVPGAGKEAGWGGWEVSGNKKTSRAARLCMINLGKAGLFLILFDCFCNPIQYFFRML